jgi:hypothetical protein
VLSRNIHTSPIPNQYRTVTAYTHSINHISIWRSLPKRISQDSRDLKTNVKRGGGIIIVKIKIVITVNNNPSQAFLSTEFISVMPQIKTGVNYKSSKNVQLLFKKLNN